MASDEILLELFHLSEDRLPYDVLCLDTEGVRLDLQQKTKDVFFKRALDLFEEDKLNRVCQRYYSKNFVDLYKQEGVLTASFVNKLAIGLSRFNEREFKHLLNDQNIEELSLGKIQKLLRIINPIPFKGRPIEPWIDTFPSKLKAMVFNDYSLQDKELVQLNNVCQKLEDQKAMDEMLAKGYASRDLEIGDILAYGKSYYKVYDVLVTGEGLSAYALLPLIKDQEHTEPIIAFPGTKFYPSGTDAASTVINDLERSMGYSGYNAGRPFLRKWLFDKNFCKDKVRLVGFSLGGIYAQMLVADYPEMIYEAVVFSSPGVSPTTVDRFYKNINKAKGPLSLTYYRVHGDSCDYFGELFVGIDVKTENVNIDVGIIYPYEELNLPGTAPHTHRFFSESHDRCDLEMVAKNKVQRQLMNQMREGTDLSEKLRKVVGPYLLKPIMLFFKYVSSLIYTPRADEKVKRLNRTFFHESFEVTKVKQRPSSIKYC